MQAQQSHADAAKDKQDFPRKIEAQQTFIANRRTDCTRGVFIPAVLVDIYDDLVDARTPILRLTLGSARLHIIGVLQKEMAAIISAQQKRFQVDTTKTADYKKKQAE